MLYSKFVYIFRYKRHLAKLISLHHRQVDTDLYKKVKLLAGRPYYSYYQVCIYDYGCMSYCSLPKPKKSFLLYSCTIICKQFFGGSICTLVYLIPLCSCVLSQTKRTIRCALKHEDHLKRCVGNTKKICFIKSPV
jgi:hypothetical protein